MPSRRPAEERDMTPRGSSLGRVSRRRGGGGGFFGPVVILLAIIVAVFLVARYMFGWARVSITP
jgi:hypothetical protein